MNESLKPIRSVSQKVVSMGQAFEKRTLLIVDDDGPFRNRLGRAMESRGFDVSLASDGRESMQIIQDIKPAFGVVDLRIGKENGLDIISVFHRELPQSRVIMLTGYGNIATAVAAVKAGAIDYLAKPADADDIEKALLADPQDRPSPPDNPMSADRIRWEHIQRVYELCDHNVSETARRLNMHRRTLQRILAKRAPR